MSDAVRKDLEDCWYGRGIYQSGWAKKSMEKFLSRNIVIPRSEMPSVEADPGGGVMVNNRSFLLCNPLESYRREALELLSAYEYAKRELEARATAALAKRRDELLLEFMPEAARINNLPTWDELNPTYQRAIDRIIELEDAAKVDA